MPNQAVSMPVTTFPSQPGAYLLVYQWMIGRSKRCRPSIPNSDLPVATITTTRTWGGCLGLQILYIGSVCNIVDWISGEKVTVSHPCCYFLRCSVYRMHIPDALDIKYQSSRGGCPSFVNLGPSIPSSWSAATRSHAKIRLVQGKL